MCDGRAAGGTKRLGTSHHYLSDGGLDGGWGVGGSAEKVAEVDFGAEDGDLLTDVVGADGEECFLTCSDTTVV